jgi:hypothetical protein
MTRCDICGFSTILWQQRARRWVCIACHAAQATWGAFRKASLVRSKPLWRPRRPKPRPKH